MNQYWNSVCSWILADCTPTESVWHLNRFLANQFQFLCRYLTDIHILSTLLLNHSHDLSSANIQQPIWKCDYLCSNAQLTSLIQKCMEIAQLMTSRCIRQWTHFCSNLCWWTLLALLCQNNPSTSQVQHKDANETLVVSVQVCRNHVVTSTTEIMISPLFVHWLVCQQESINTSKCISSLTLDESRPRIEPV